MVAGNVAAFEVLVDAFGAAHLQNVEEEANCEVVGTVQDPFVGFIGVLYCFFHVRDSLINNIAGNSFALCLIAEKDNRPDQCIVEPNSP